MPDAAIDFDAPDLACRIGRLTEADIDRLPFGVVRLDRTGVITLYSKTESRLSGFPGNPVGQNMFAISSCMGSDEFRGRVVRAMEAGAVDLEIAWTGDYNDPKRDLRIRVQSSASGELWMFVERDGARAG